MGGLLVSPLCDVADFLWAASVLVLIAVCFILVYVVLCAGAKTQLEALQGCSMGAGAAAAASMKLLQLRLASSSPSLQSLWPGEHQMLAEKI